MKELKQKNIRENQRGPLQHENMRTELTNNSQIQSQKLLCKMALTKELFSI